MAATGCSVCAGKQSQAARVVGGGGGVCAELIEFVLPALTLGPVAYQATSPRAPLERSAPTRASDITSTPPADVDPLPPPPPPPYSPNLVG